MPLANSTYIPIPPLQSYPTFNSFYPFYLGEHSNLVCRRLHITGTVYVWTADVPGRYYALTKILNIPGTACVTSLLLYALLTRNLSKLLYVPLVGYGFAWVSRCLGKKWHSKQNVDIHHQPRLVTSFSVSFQITLNEVVDTVVLWKWLSTHAAPPPFTLTFKLSHYFCMPKRKTNLQHSNTPYTLSWAIGSYFMRC